MSFWLYDYIQITYKEWCKNFIAWTIVFKRILKDLQTEFYNKQMQKWVPDSTKVLYMKAKCFIKNGARF